MKKALAAAAVVVALVAATANDPHMWVTAKKDAAVALQSSGRWLARV